jgi:hypothetical protein
MSPKISIQDKKKTIPRHLGFDVSKDLVATSGVDTSSWQASEVFTSNYTLADSFLNDVAERKRSILSCAYKIKARGYKIKI